jgi:hypothetical protein
MKSILALTVLLLIPSPVSGEEVKKDYRQDSSYVAPAQETHADAADKNYSFRENVGSKSSRIMPGEPDNHLDRHYQASPKKEQSYSPLNPFVLRW